MSISSSLNAGVMGLNANSTRLSTISDNIANSETFGYKRSQVEFSSMVLEQRSSAYSAGGVMVDTFKDVSAVGSLISTGNATDIAVAGRGLVPVTDVQGVDQSAADRNLMLLPTGSFTADQNGNLRTQSGLFLLGWPADSTGSIGNVSRNSGTNLEPVNIATSQFVASPTASIEVGINLPADATDAGAQAAATACRLSTMTISAARRPCAWTSRQWFRAQDLRISGKFRSLTMLVTRPPQSARWTSRLTTHLQMAAESPASRHPAARLTTPPPAKSR